MVDVLYAQINVSTIPCYACDGVGVYNRGWICKLNCW